MTLDRDRILSKTDVKDQVVWLKLMFRGEAEQRPSSPTIVTLSWRWSWRCRSRKIHGSHCHTEVIETDVLTIDIHFLCTLSHFPTIIVQWFWSTWTGVLLRWSFPWQHGGFPLPRLNMNLAQLQWSRVMSFEKVGDVRIPCSHLGFSRLVKCDGFALRGRSPFSRRYDSNLLDNRTNRL